MSETLEGLKGRLGTLKRALESKWLRADAMKTKMMISNENAVKASCSNRRRPQKGQGISSNASFAGAE